MNKFKAWLRGLAPLQAGIFYMAVAFCLYLIIIHNPFLGYSTYESFINLYTRKPLERPEILSDIDELKVLLIWILGTICVTTFFIWLTGIRNQKPTAQDTSSESPRSNQQSVQKPEKFDIAHEQPKLQPNKIPVKKINHCRGKKLLLGWWLAFCVTVVVNARLDILYGRYVSIHLSLAQNAPSYITISALSPTFLQCLSYMGAFQKAHYLRLRDNGYSEDEAIEKSEIKEFEGLVWGLAQGFAFYLPLIFFRKNRSADRSLITEANPSERSGIISTQNQNEQAQDSKEKESD